MYFCKHKLVKYGCISAISEIFGVSYNESKFARILQNNQYGDFHTKKIQKQIRSGTQKIKWEKLSH